MAQLLYVEASPMGELSHSSTVTQHDFLPAYQQAFPADTIDHLNLWELSMPAFNRALHNTKYAVHHHLTLSAEQQADWQAVEAMARRFLQADRYVFSVPMWNFGIPYILKQYIDVMCQSDWFFHVTESGDIQGLVTGKPLVLILARGGAYQAGSGKEAWDFQAPYLFRIMEFIGFTDIRPIYIQPTGMGEAALQDALEKARQEAARLPWLLPDAAKSVVSN